MKKLYLPLIAAALTACSGNKTESVASIDTDADVDIATDIDDDYDPYAPSECISEDSLVTIQSAMYPGGGTSPDYWARWIFPNAEGKQCKVYKPDSPAINDVHAIHKDDGSTYYIVRCFAKASSIDGYEWLEAYKIEGDTIKRVQVIDGSDMPVVDDDYEINDSPFSINYCIPNVYFASDGAAYDWMYEYDPETRNLYVPIIVGEFFADTYLSDRYRLWHFNGKRFEDMGEHPHKGLHPSVGDYVQLVQLFETKDYIVRVDSLASRELRYASWKKPKTIGQKPDIVLVGGRKVLHPVSPDELRPDDDYRFTAADGYEYIVNYCEVTPHPEGGGEHHDFLVVKKDGKTILKQEKKFDY